MKSWKINRHNIKIVNRALLLTFWPSQIPVFFLSRSGRILSGGSSPLQPSGQAE